MDKEDEPLWKKKQREYEIKKARAKALKLRLTCTICGARPKTLLNCPCGTTQYCSTECQRIDWRDRGHRKACKKIRDERAAEAARAEAPTPPPSPPVYGPAPRSHADEVRARIAAEHEAARARREANPEPEPVIARFGGRCPLCLEDWDVNETPRLRACCCRRICKSCFEKLEGKDCPLCRKPMPGIGETLARLRYHAQNEVPEAMNALGEIHRDGRPGAVKCTRKAAKLWKRAVELGNVSAMINLGVLYDHGDGAMKKDMKKAFQLYQMAAERGFAKGQFNLGSMFYDELAFKDDKKAFHYFKLAAEQGYVLAMPKVAYCYVNEIGVGRDIGEAKRWYARAAANGDEESAGALEFLNARRR